MHVKGGVRRFPTRARQKKAQQEEVKPDEDYAAEMELPSGQSTGLRMVRTLVFVLTPLDPSIQMYSARTEPFWSSFMYFMSW